MSSPPIEKGSSIRKIFEKQCQPYCSYITDAMKDVSPIVFNEKSCIAQCVKQQMRKRRRKEYEKGKLK